MLLVNSDKTEHFLLKVKEKILSLWLLQCGARVGALPSVYTVPGTQAVAGGSNNSKVITSGH